VQLIPVGAGDRARLTALLELYVYDFSALLGIDVAEDGHFVLPSLDVYFGDPACHAFLLRVADKLAGFALVQERSRLTGESGVCDLAEFLVLRKYRRQGVGQEAAHWLFDHFPARWEVRQRPENGDATVFWRRVIGAYTGGKFEDLVFDDDKWKGPVQRFDSRR
jgi:predicted acetyltransferase